MPQTAVALAFLTVLGSVGAAEPEPMRLFQSGRDGYPRYRIPSLVVTPGGVVLAICEGRKGGRGLLGDIDLVVRASRDSGKTWSPLQVFADEGEHTLGNPCAVVDQMTKDVWVAFTRSKGSDTEEGIVAGTSDERTRVRVTKSSDGGATWSAPVDITATAKDPSWTWYGTGPGVGIQLKSGRLVVPSYHVKEKASVYRSHMVYSDDHGRTWRRGDPVGEHSSECHVAECGDGTLVLNARTTEGLDRRTIARSTDGGETWSAAAKDENLYDPHCEACLFALPPLNNEPRWIFTHPAGPGRRNMTVRLSRDEGKSWPVARKLLDGDSQYSCLALLPDGSIGCLLDRWESGNYQLDFVRFTREWLEAKP
ncbi:MAG: exo-alpha-sialidase [Planctomycetaceae bacterium]|nr:exo-alpha-sialidase [Planctomycetaceae bacterium]